MKISFKKMQSLINDIIENEFNHILYGGIEEGTNDEELNRLKKINEEVKEIEDYFKEKLSEEDYNKIILLQNKLFEQAVIEKKYYFNRGVRSAFDNLKFLEEYFYVF